MYLLLRRAGVSCESDVDVLVGADGLGGGGIGRGKDAYLLVLLVLGL